MATNRLEAFFRAEGKDAEHQAPENMEDVQVFATIREATAWLLSRDVAMVSTFCVEESSTHKLCRVRKADGTLLTIDEARRIPSNGMPDATAFALGDAVAKAAAEGKVGTPIPPLSAVDAAENDARGRALLRGFLETLLPLLDASALRHDGFAPMLAIVRQWIVDHPEETVRALAIVGMQTVVDIGRERRGTP